MSKRITKKELVEYAFRIKPLVRVLKTTTSTETKYGVQTKTKTTVISLDDNWEEGKLSYISPRNDIADETFMSDPKPVLVVDDNKLEEVGNFIAKFEDCRFFFKPSVKEVIEQMPDYLLEEADCFEIVEPDLTPRYDGICQAKVIVYKSLLKNKHPEEILNQTVKCEGKKYKPELNKHEEIENTL